MLAVPSGERQVCRQLRPDAREQRCKEPPGEDHSGALRSRARNYDRATDHSKRERATGKAPISKYAIEKRLAEEIRRKYESHPGGEIPSLCWHLFLLKKKRLQFPVEGDDVTLEWG